MGTNSSLRAAEQLYAALEADDTPGFLELCAEDVSFRYPAEGRLPYGGLWEGRAGVARFMDAHDRAEEILAFEVNRMVAEGDTVFVLGSFAGRAKPDGREWSTQFAHHLTVTDGQLRLWEAFFDTAAAVDARAPRDEVIGVRELDGMRIIGPADGAFVAGNRSKSRELISALETGDRWSLGEVMAEPDENVATHFHPGEPEAFIILEGPVELHGARGVAHLEPGDVVFIPPDTEHGLRTPTGGRWLAVWPIRERVPGKRYAG